MSDMTIGRLAEAAGVNVETVRYYQRLGLLEAPAPQGAYRHYGEAHLQQLQFIRRAKEAGFSLEEVGELLHLDAVADRRRIRMLAAHRLDDIQGRIADLQALAQRLQVLIARCESDTGNSCCPIVETFRG